MLRHKILIKNIEQLTFYSCSNNFYESRKLCVKFLKGKMNGEN
jgi:hypothetical protein